MRIVATAPVRTADVGGWTDTWFASTGAVCSVAVEPGVTVRLDSMPGRAGQVRLRVPAADVDLSIDDHDADPLLVAALRTRTLSAAVRVTIESGVPAGSGLGTSAAVSVALLAAMDAAGGCSRDAHALACAAHRVETGLGLQSGIQDQLAAAFGGVRHYDVEYPYGGAVHAIGDESLMAELDVRLLTAYLGRPHSSSALHDLVIASLEGVDNEERLAPIRAAAHRASAALRCGDLDAYGSSMTAGHDGIRGLHADLVCDDASRVIELAAANGAIGWKVNGAGGSGGSVAILGPADTRSMTALAAALDAQPGVELLRTRVARSGVRVAIG